MKDSFFYAYPIVLTGLLLTLALFAAMELGFYLGRRQAARWPEGDTPVGKMVLTTLFALLGLILAFTYSAGVSRYEARKAAAVEESNALGTAFLRADLLREPGRSELRFVLYEYAQTRTYPQGYLYTPAEAQVIIDRTLAAQALVWPAMRKAAAEDNPVPVVLAVVAAVNNVLDIHNVRLMADFDKLPSVVVWLLVFIACCAIGVLGFNAGLVGRMSRWRMGSLAMVLVYVILMIVDFDRPDDGFIQVDLRAIDVVVAEMGAALAKS